MESYQFDSIKERLDIIIQLLAKKEEQKEKPKGAV
jgi:hypothetical protein